MIFTKHRFEIWSQSQHPLKHSIDDFSYSNPAAPGVTTLNGAFNWLFAALYPNAAAAVDTQSDLPLGGVITNTVASPTTLTLAAHNFKTQDPVRFTTTGTLPTGLSSGVTYYVQSPGINTFQISTDKVGSSLVGLSDTGAGTHSVAAQLGTYKVVLDDGDGKAASYRWEQREGEVSASWHKIYDMDWGQDSILAAFQSNTQDLYVWKNGRTELDSGGSPVVGLYAGQIIYGGDLVNQNLTLRANSGDGVGAHTGYVQADDNFRPTVHDTYDLGTGAIRWKNIYAQSSAVIGTLSIVSGSITDSSGAISFDNEDLTTTGDIAGNIITASTKLVVDDTSDSVEIIPGSYTDSTGAISFGVSNLDTTGTLAAGITTLTDNAQTLIFDPDATGVGRITSSTGEINFDNENLSTTGNLQVGQVTGTRLDIDNIRLDGNTLSILDVNGNFLIQANGTGIVDVQSAMTTLGITATGVVGVTGQLNIDNIRLDGNTLSSQNLNGSITINPNGTGSVITTGNFVPNADNTLDLGGTTATWKDLYIKGVISNDTNTIAISTVLAFRSGIWRDLAQSVPAQAGDTLFYDAVNGVWLANHPDTEITHSELTGLTTTDAGHTQFVMLAGRSGGQTIQGGTVASENLILESTAHATKGSILSKDNFIPFSNASYSGSWSGIDLGDSTHYFRDLYTRGELKGARFENYTSGTLPASSGQNVGRVVFATDNTKAYVDTGTAFKVLGVSKYISDTSWNGTDVTKSVTVSSDVSDARNCVWQLRDNANDFEVMNVKITTPDAATVTITVNVPLAVGSYRLIGLE